MCSAWTSPFEASYLEIRKKGTGMQLQWRLELIIEPIEHYPMTTIITDAVDECETEERQLLLDAFKSLLQESSLGLVEIFLSSRDDRDIVCTLQDYPNVDVVFD